MRQATILQDRLVVVGGMEFRCSFPELEGVTPSVVQFSYTVSSEEELRELVELCGGAGPFFDVFRTARTTEQLLLTGTGLCTEAGRRAGVAVHLEGDAFAPAPAPVPLVERLRQEGLQAIDGALETADLDLAGRDA